MVRPRTRGITDLSLQSTTNHEIITPSKDNKNHKHSIGRVGGPGVRNGTGDVKEALARLAKEKSNLKKEKKLRDKSRRPSSINGSAASNDFSFSVADLTNDICTASSLPMKRTVAKNHCENDNSSTKFYSYDRGNTINMLLFTILEEDPESERDMENENNDVLGAAVELSCQQHRQQNSSVQERQHSLFDEKDGVTANNSVQTAAAVIVTTSVPQSITKDELIKMDETGGAIVTRNIYDDKVLATTVMAAANKAASSAKASKTTLAEALESAPVATASKTPSDSTASPLPQTWGKDFPPPLPSTIVIKERNECNAHDYQYHYNDCAVLDVAEYARSEKNIVMTPPTDEHDEMIYRDEESCCSSYNGSNPSNLTEEKNDFIDELSSNDGSSCDDDRYDAQVNTAIVGRNLEQDHHSTEELVAFSGSDSGHGEKHNGAQNAIRIKMEAMPIQPKLEEELRSCHENVERGCRQSSDVLLNVNYGGRVDGSQQTEFCRQFSVTLIDDNVSTESDDLGDSLTLLSLLHEVQSPISESDDAQRKILIGKKIIELENQSTEDLIGSSGSGFVFDVPEITMLDSNLLQDDVDSNDSGYGEKHSERQNDIYCGEKYDEAQNAMETMPKQLKLEEEPRNCHDNVEKGCVQSNDVFCNVEYEGHVFGLQYDATALHQSNLHMKGHEKKKKKKQQFVGGNNYIAEEKKMAYDNAKRDASKGLFDQTINATGQSSLSIKSHETSANFPKVLPTLRKSCPSSISLIQGSLGTKNDETLETTYIAGTRRGAKNVEFDYPTNTCREWIAEESGSQNTALFENETQAKDSFISKKSVNNHPNQSSLSMKSHETSTNYPKVFPTLRKSWPPLISLKRGSLGKKNDETSETTNIEETRRGAKDVASDYPTNTCSREWIADESGSQNTASFENEKQAQAAFISKKSVLKNIPNVMFEKTTSKIPADTLANCHSSPSKILSQRLRLVKDKQSSNDLDPDRLGQRMQDFSQKSFLDMKSSVHDIVGTRDERTEEQKAVIVDKHHFNRPRNPHVTSHRYSQHELQQNRNKSAVRGGCASANYINAASFNPSSNSISLSDHPGHHLPQHCGDSTNHKDVTDDSKRRAQYGTHVSWEDLEYAIESCISVSLLEMNEKIHANNNFARFKTDSSTISSPNLFQPDTNHYTGQQKTCYYSGGQRRGHDVSWDELSDAISEGRRKSINDITRQVVERQQEWSLEARRKGSHRHKGEVDKPWQCATCTFVNQHGSFLVCGICNTPKYQLVEGNVIERKCRNRTDKNRRGSSPI
ncbi:hypothetical protein ACHAXA_001186 [Cyclostephanos tholiformis]|uniref:RanBP2-type domain-containing protein n=1 Tax=Cyclostephanos tholiformis TaxID=382380 RepID=A0ABD3SR41_9STRA